MFEDFYRNFSRDATWSAKDAMQFHQNIKISKISCGPPIDIYFVRLGFAIAEYNGLKKRGGV